MDIIGITRIRNESQIIEDTLQHMEQICDGLLVYDDASTDDTAALVRRSSSKLIELVQGASWDSNRPRAETVHRELLAKKAAALGPKWILCFDADERFEPGLRDWLLSSAAREVDGARVRYFDGYLTREAGADYRRGEAMEQLARKYGPECRDILVAWRPGPLFHYEGLDQREPKNAPAARITLAPSRCKHFGKSVSVAQWEETCDYYANNFPEPYKTKWTERKGKAIHTHSDFGAPLYDWDEVGQHAIPIHPTPLPAAIAPVRLSLLERLSTKLVRRLQGR